MLLVDVFIFKAVTSWSLQLIKLYRSWRPRARHALSCMNQGELDNKFTEIIKGSKRSHQDSKQQVILYCMLFESNSLTSQWFLSGLRPANTVFILISSKSLLLGDVCLVFAWEFQHCCASTWILATVFFWVCATLVLVWLKAACCVVLGHMSLPRGNKSSTCNSEVSQLASAAMSLHSISPISFTLQFPINAFKM